MAAAAGTAPWYQTGDPNSSWGYGYASKGWADPYGNAYNQGQVTGDIGDVYSHNYTPELPGGGQGKPFVQERQGQAIATLGSGVTSGEGDASLREAMRQKYMTQLNSFDPSTQGMNDQYDRSLNNSISTARRQLGGTGLSGSLQAGRGIGDIIGSSNQQRAQGLAGLQSQQAQTLGTLNQTEGNTLQQSLQERGYTLEQAKSLSDLLMQQAGMEQNSILGTATQPGPSDLEKGLGYLAGGIGAAGSLMSGIGNLNAGNASANLNNKRAASYYG